MEFGSVAVILAFSLSEQPDPVVAKLEPRKAWRRLALVPLVIVLAFGVRELSYTPPDAFGAKRAQIEGLLVEARYSEAVEAADELFRSWRFNKNFQLLYTRTLLEAGEAGALTSDEYTERLAEAHSLLAGVNPLYTRYISGENPDILPD
jgi:hypothetical protein